MAVIHVIIFLTLNLISIESPELVDHIMLFFMPFMTMTIILGVWAFQIIIRMVIPYYANLNLLKKFMSFQLVLIFCKLQPVLMTLILTPLLKCEEPFTIAVKTNGEYIHMWIKKWLNIYFSSNHNDCDTIRNVSSVAVGWSVT